MTVRRRVTGLLCQTRRRYGERGQGAWVNSRSANQSAAAAGCACGVCVAFCTHVSLLPATHATLLHVALSFGACSAPNSFSLRHPLPLTPPYLESPACSRAKAKRERLRQAHLAPDYLPLGGASKLLGVTSSAAAGAGGGGSNTGVAIAGGPYGGSESEGDQDSQDGGGGSQGLRPPRQQGLGGSDSETELEERMRLTFVGQQQQQQQPKGRGSSGKGGGSRAAAAAAMASGQYAATVQDDEMQEDADGDTHMGGPVIQQRLAAAIKRNAAGGGGSSRLAGAAAGGAGGMRGEAAIAAAAAAVLESLQEATGRATARHKQLSANLKRTDDNLVNALEEADRIKVCV